MQLGGSAPARARLALRLQSLFEAALRAVEPEAAVRRAVSVVDGTLHLASTPVLDLGLVDQVVVLGAGKASVPLTRGLLGVLGQRIAGGVVIVPHGLRTALGPVEVLEGGHPIPDAAGVRATGRVLAAAEALGPRDLALVVVSGGGSALLCSPWPEVGLEGLASVTRRLLRSGADIAEINAVRAVLDEVKGGGLARRIAPASLVTVAVSDVPGDDPKVLASGPTVPGDPSVAAARRVLARRGVDVPAGWLRPRPAEPVRPGAWAVVANLAKALDAAEVEARAFGWDPERLGGELVGEADAVGRALGWRLRGLTSGRATSPDAAAGDPPGRCLLAGGEPVVRVTGAGRGGRAQQVALAAAEVLAGTEGMLLAAGTDGRDGPTDAAGALVDGTTWQRALDLGLDPRRALDGHDSYPILDAVGALIRTGPTGTNVRDLFIGWG